MFKHNISEKFAEFFMAVFFLFMGQDLFSFFGANPKIKDFLSSVINFESAFLGEFLPAAIGTPNLTTVRRNN